MSRKLEYAIAAQNAITTLDDLISRLNELDDIFINSGYNAKGSNPITASDLGATSLKPQDLANISAFVKNIDLFLNAGDPLKFNYAGAINALRNMPS